ncbi:dihydrodipicolinate synthase family protein [Paracoccus sp. 11-3]|uniref:Dihydrodipicolinate synthase family protein n=1 Tax=Paracoccus amoyensis TaxID=2760093 RepID=A0A926JDV8_9RHOB|nr:dihydrodipicolinate synthase family protein [Paracoccus amoyensis]MBC9248139.1 dihydrodipicolinate synthase family protein [Paracoccus amoyensis]
MSVFSGLSAFPITPTDANGRLSTADFNGLLNSLVEACSGDTALDSICLLGSTGTYAYQSLDQRKHAAEAGIAAIKGRTPTIIGIGTLRTDHAQELAAHARQAGAEGLLMAPFSYTPLTDEEAFQHYAAVAATTDLPLCIYNNPSTTHFNFSTALLQRLADIPTIEAVKMPLPADCDFEGQLPQLRAALPSGFLIGYSGDWQCADGLLAGADSWFSAVAGLLPVQTLKLSQAARSRNHAETARLQEIFEPLWELFREYGSLRVIYAAANIMSLSDAQPPRPILAMPENQLHRLRDALDAVNRL